MMNYRMILEIATGAVMGLTEHTVDVLSIRRPTELQGAIELSKIISKLSPIIGNLLEYHIVRYLNSVHEWPANCHWIRQDPGFPDAILSGMSYPQPGIEIKTWFPLATEITARFRDSQNHFEANQTKVAMVCWLPEFVIAGEPKIVGVWVGDAIEVARARDSHYHNPPHYVVMEPEDTSDRTRNLQQTNCNGLRFQGTEAQLSEALAAVDALGPEGRLYRPDREAQAMIREITSRYSYRLDTNFAKMDRIVLPGLEEFKARMLRTVYFGHSLSQWIRAIAISDPQLLSSLVDPQLSEPLQPAGEYDGGSPGTDPRKDSSNG